MLLPLQMFEKGHVDLQLLAMLGNSKVAGDQARFWSDRKRYQAEKVMGENTETNIC